jgi:hypothetical protein
MMALFNGEHVIDDSTPIQQTDPPAGMSKGLMLGMRTTPFGMMFGTTAMPDELLIPRSEWQARIEEMEQRKSRLSDISIAAGLPCLDQNGTNLCWANAPVHCVEILRVAQNQPMVPLSPASVGACREMARQCHQPAVLHPGEYGYCRGLQGD